MQPWRTPSDRRRLLRNAGAQLATRWLMRSPEITTVLIGASRVAQLDDIHAGLALAPLSEDELARIETILAG